MIIFPRIMITAAGVMLLVILTFAGVRLFPAHASLAGAIGAAIGCLLNSVIQFGLYRAWRQTPNALPFNPRFGPCCAAPAY
jgi:protein-S-isoprenylcysteine O-methyltransferase Ste14